MNTPFIAAAVKILLLDLLQLRLAAGAYDSPPDSLVGTSLLSPPPK